ncbi:type I secretion system permease/ATPase [Oricola nitratireducens]|uniref:type I secretion system permease/ATPase n=1 Tax=Oricola nitratireducens TaxID=2775868 RepID=UPI001866BAB7|nr:type I secretion system permease/ATPase [Oricola nitratireducens]
MNDIRNFLNRSYAPLRADEKPVADPDAPRGDALDDLIRELDALTAGLQREAGRRASATEVEEANPAPDSPISEPEESDGEQEPIAEIVDPDPISEISDPEPAVETPEQKMYPEPGEQKPAADPAGWSPRQNNGVPRQEFVQVPSTGRLDQATPQPADMRAADAPEPEEMRAADTPQPEEMRVAEPPTSAPISARTIDADKGPVKTREAEAGAGGPADGGRSGSGSGGGGGHFHKRLGPVDFSRSLKAGVKAVRYNLTVVMFFTLATNILVLAIPLYLFQISDRVFTSRSTDTLIMLTVVIVGAVILQVIFDAIRRFILMRTAVEVAAQLGSPILSAAARAALHSNGREYQILGDLQQLRSFLVSATLLSFLDGPFTPIFIAAIFLIHTDLGLIVVTTALALLIIALFNQRATSAPFAEATQYQSKANLHLDSMSRNSQIINALAMIPEAVSIWGRDTASSLRAQVHAQDRNIISASISRGVRLLTQIALLGWGANLALHGEITGGMVIAGSIVAGRALAPIEGVIEGWNQFLLSRSAYGRIAQLLTASPLNFERLRLPKPEGRLDVERLLYVPQGTKRVVLNSISFALQPGDSLAIIGDSGAGKTTLGKMLVGSVLPTSGSVRLDLMDLRNWDQRQFGENIGYLPQDVQLFPGTIKGNIARMREDATDAQIFEAAALADVHEMISSLPQGYETIVAADGSPLSGGQKQRIALARAFFGNPRMVVLDEPNSNLDANGDQALARALAHAKANRITVIAITQKPSLLRHVDKILLLTNGTVSMFGRRQDVLQALSNMQNGGQIGPNGRQG